jgi:hypothetical protein
VYIVSWEGAVKMYVAVATTRRTNIGTTLRCAVAFGCTAMIVVGDINYGTHGAHGSQTRIKVIHFHSWSAFHHFAKENNCLTYGIVDTDFSRPFSTETTTEFPNNQQIIFLSGIKFGQLSEEQIEVCDAFIAVSFCGGIQFAKHVHGDVKLSICLHQCASSTKMEEGSFVGEKYLLTDSKPQAERFESKSLCSSSENYEPEAEVNLGEVNLFKSTVADY